MAFCWRPWSQRAAKVGSRANAEVPVHPRGIISYSRIRNPSISLQVQQTAEENADPPGRYRPAGCGNPNPTWQLLIGWCPWSQPAAKVAPRANAEVPRRWHEGNSRRALAPWAPANQQSVRGVWGYHTARGGIDPGDLCFRPWTVGVVEASKDSSPGDGIFILRGCSETSTLARGATLTAR